MPSEEVRGCNVWSYRFAQGLKSMRASLDRYRAPRSLDPICPTIRRGVMLVEMLGSYLFATASRGGYLGSTRSEESGDFVRAGDKTLTLWCQSLSSAEWFTDVEERRIARVVVGLLGHASLALDGAVYTVSLRSSHSAVVHQDADIIVRVRDALRSQVGGSKVGWIKIRCLLTPSFIDR
jgi:hypothetical protein